MLGTTTLNGFVLDDLKGRVNGLRVDKQDLEDQVRARESEVAALSSAVATLSPALVQGRLAGRDVVVVTLPGAPSGTRDAVTGLLARSGATLEAVVAVQSSLVTPGDPAALATTLTDLGAGGATAATASQAAAMLLGGTLVARPVAAATPAPGPSASPSPSGAPSSLAAVLGGLADQGLVSVDGTLTGPTPLLVVLTSAAPEKPARDFALALATAADTRGGAVVMAAPSADASTPAEDTVMAALRADGGPGGRVSGVDDADSEAGQLAVVLALVAESRGGSGQYGTAAGADAVLPRVPMPAVSATPAS